MTAVLLRENKLAYKNIEAQGKDRFLQDKQKGHEETNPADFPGSPTSVSRN